MYGTSNLNAMPKLKGANTETKRETTINVEHACKTTPLVLRTLREKRQIHGLDTLMSAI